MGKIVSTKRTSAIFLAIVLVAGTIAAISPLFNIKEVNAQGDPYYVMDRYDDRKSYGNHYGYDNSPQYQSSYKPDYYKPAYPSYVKNDRDKSKDSSSKSVSINKIKCINTNLNINGKNAGNVSIGNKGAVEGYVGGYSSNGGGPGGAYDGYSKKGFDCVINNNNTNTNIVIGGGNVTDDDVVDTCEECFSVNSTLQMVIENFLIDATGEVLFVLGSESLVIPGDVDTIEQLCPLLEDHTDSFVEFVITVIVERQIGSAIGNEAAIDALVECLLEAGVIVEATV